MTASSYVNAMRLKKKYIFVPILSLLISGNAISQNEAFHFWKLHSLSGEAKLYGHYREQERNGLNFKEFQKSSFYSGGLLLRTSSSIVHPNFLMLDIDAGYTPESSRDKFIITPNQAEVRTLKKIGINGQFLQQKKVSLNFFENYDESYSTRENLSNIKSKNRLLGGILNLNNKIIPITFNASSRKWDEEEVKSGRKYTLDQNTYGAQMSKSFSAHDRNSFKYSHDEYVNINQNLFRIANTTENLDFTSYVSLGSKRKFNLNTLVSDFNQRGNMNLRRLQASENINAGLTKRITFFGNYSYNKIGQDFSNLSQHSVDAHLQHQLFESLQSKINADFNFINHTVYQEFNRRAGIEFNYTKKIPTGQLLINYRFDRYHQDYKSDPFLVYVANESYVLSDNKINLLRIADINIESVVVRDVTGTIIYQKGIDYLAISRKNFVEIRRIPGGKIEDNSTVYVDYNATQPGSYKYDSNTQVFSTSIYLLKNLLSLNYRYSTQGYSNLEKTDRVTLNYFTQNLVGCRLDFGFIETGAEYEDYKSSILPYRRMRYYANLQKKIREKLTLMLNGNMQDYVMLDEPVAKYQKYSDVTGKINYSIFKQTSLNVDLMYRKQSGRGIDLNLVTARTELTSAFSHLQLTLGLELYRQNYIGEIINFNGTYLKISRKF